MSDWKRRALELAEVVMFHRKNRTYGNMVQGWSVAQQLIDLGKREGKAQQKFMEHWRCPDKKEREKLYEEYLEMIR